MNNILLASIAGVFVVGAVGTAFYIRRKKLEKEILEKTVQIEGELQFEDVLSYFRSLNLKQESHMPLIANADSDELQKVTKGILKSKNGYRLLMLGVYDKTTDEIIHPKFIYSSRWSAKLSDIMGEEKIVILE